MDKIEKIKKTPEEPPTLTINEVERARRDEIEKLLNEFRLEVTSPNKLITIETLAVCQRAFADQILAIVKEVLPELAKAKSLIKSSVLNEEDLCYWESNQRSSLYEAVPFEG